MTKCNHNIKSPECTIRFLTHRHMVEENIKYGICPICSKSFAIDGTKNTCIEVGCAAESAKEDEVG